MIRLHDPGVDSATARALTGYQAQVDSAGAYPAQVAKAQALFKNRNTATNPTFRVIRQQLRRMCAAPDRCGWCEDSEAGEIDHIRPKTLYPECTFVWENYLGACGICNNRKSNRFAILDQGRILDVTRKPNQPVAKPSSGPSALINPRLEDPLAFLELEARYTFQFLPRFGLPEIDSERARYTTELLSLNREALMSARRLVFAGNRELLSRYRDLRESGTGSARLQQFKDAFLKRPHPTVWREMQRQHELPDLIDLFKDVPEALAW